MTTHSEAQDISPAESSVDRSRGPSGTVFWRVAAAMIAIQIVIAVLAAGFTIWYAQDAQRSLAAVAISARLDALAEEIERRATSFDIDLSGFPGALQLDLRYRFPDPMVVIDLASRSSSIFLPALDGFPSLSARPDSTIEIPEFVGSDEVLDDVVVDFSDDFVEGGFASAPLIDDTGFPVGIILVQPIRNSMTLELAETLRAFRRSVRIVALLSIFIALLLGAFITWWLVRPLRNMAMRVNLIGQGSYEERLEVKGNDEFSSLASAINLMSERVQHSIAVLKESELLRRELVANIGHDLRTPLAAIRAHLEESTRFRQEKRYDEAGASVLAAERQSVYLNALVDDLFELGVLESTQPRLREEPVLPGELVSDAISGNQSLAAQGGVKLERRVQDDLPPLRADGTRLLRLLNNLLSNGIRHTPPQGRVCITAELDGDVIQIEVIDTGEGIGKEDLERLFDRYYRGKDSRTRSGWDSRQGTGLGLAISRAIAHAHGGTLEAISTIGEGTTMRLRIPVT